MQKLSSMRIAPVSAPPLWLKRGLASSRLVDAGAVWKRLSGGKTNAVWKVSARSRALVCKLFLKDNNPLYPNDPELEHAVLEGLGGMGLAPEPRFLVHVQGHDVLGYDFVPAIDASPDAIGVAEMLGRLHEISLPSLKTAPSGSDALARQVHEILGECLSRPPSFPAELPAGHVGSSDRNALIHRDVVPGNIIASRKGPMLIDWQCPALGDPAEDLASFLSPAMQYLYAGRPLPKATEMAFLDAYPHRATVERYLALRPLFHLRMVAYCHWRAERGADGYARARDLELSALRQLQRDDQQAGGDDAEAEISG